MANEEFVLSMAALRATVVAYRAKQKALGLDSWETMVGEATQWTEEQKKELEAFCEAEHLGVCEDTLGFLWVIFHDEKP